MKKIISGWILISMILISVSGCGGTENRSSDASGTTNAAASSDSTEQAQSESGTAHAASPEISVLFYNAGKADCILIRTEDSTVMIDTGTNAFGKSLVSDLAARGIEKIDVLFITHFDKDHVGGADSVLNQIAVGEVYEPDYETDSKQMDQYLEALASSGVTVHTLSDNVSFTLDGVTYTVDVANADFYTDDPDNNISLVISMEYGDVSFLFAGDAENDRLKELLAEGFADYTVLKVPHHGGLEKKSDEFFAAVSPEYAVITSDLENPEDAAVVSLLEALGTKVYLTRNGNVTCTTDGKTVTFSQ